MIPNCAAGSECPARQQLYAMLAYRLGRNEADIIGHLNLIEELYVDSLDMVEIEIGVAQTFGVELTEQTLLNVETVEDLYQAVSALKAARIQSHDGS